jgi:hypothetical protein
MRTIRITTRVRGDLESVVRWWCDPQRSSEQRSEYELSSIADFSWQESSESGVLTAEGEWTAHNHVSVRLRVVTMIGPDGVQRLPDGSFVRQQQIYQERHHRNGRHDTTESRRLTEFRERGSMDTTVTSTTMVRRAGLHWWEELGLRLSERRHREMHLHDWAFRCESALATIPPTAMGP